MCVECVVQSVTMAMGESLESEGGAGAEAPGQAVELFINCPAANLIEIHRASSKPSRRCPSYSVLRSLSSYLYMQRGLRPG